MTQLERFRKELVAARRRLKGDRLRDERAGHPDVAQALSELSVLDAVITALDRAFEKE